MKLIINSAILASHRKQLTPLIPVDKDSVHMVSITLTATGNLTITSFGFKHTLPCKTSKWGRVVLPFKVWHFALEKILPFFMDDKITIQASTGSFKINSFEILNPEINYVRKDTFPLSVPQDPTSLQIINLISKFGFAELQESGAWRTTDKVLSNLALAIESAVSTLSDFGISKEDLVPTISKKVGIYSPNHLYNQLFGEKRYTT